MRKRICSVSLLFHSNFSSHSVSSLFLARVWISTRWWKLATLSARRWIKPQTPKSPKPPSKLDLNEFRIWELKDSFQSQFVVESLMPTHSEVEVNLKKIKGRSGKEEMLWKDYQWVDHNVGERQYQPSGELQAET